MNAEFAVLVVLALCVVAAAVAWLRSRRKRLDDASTRSVPGDAVHDEDEASRDGSHHRDDGPGQRSETSTDTGPTALSVPGSGGPSSNQYDDFLAASVNYSGNSPATLAEADQGGSPFDVESASPGLDDGTSSTGGSSTYGHVFDTMLGEGVTVSPAEPGTRALRCLAPGGASLVMTRGTHKVGRSRSNDLRLDDPSVSRIHAAFHSTEEGEYEVRDLQSLNGLFINGRKRRQAMLVPGDRVELGDARLDYIALALDET